MQTPNHDQHRKEQILSCDFEKTPEHFFSKLSKKSGNIGSDWSF